MKIMIVLQSVRENPILSKENKILPNKPHNNNILEEGDHDKRLDFCLWVGSKILGCDRGLRILIMFSDESIFSTNGTVAFSLYRSDVNLAFRIPTGVN